MTANKNWSCPYCTQKSSRRWNMKVHIARIHGTEDPVERVKSTHEDMYGSSGSYETNDNNGSFNRSMRGTSSTSSTTAATNRISEARKIWQGSVILDQYYRMALETEENRIKFKKIKDVFGEIPFSVIQCINAELFNFSSEITSEPPIPPMGTSFQKKYSVTPVKSNAVNDSDVKGMTESNETTQEKPKRPPFDEYKKTKPEATFDEYRKIGRTPVTDWEPVPSGMMLVKRNAFGEVIDFLILRKCGIYM
jgi:hypothetical protein